MKGINKVTIVGSLGQDPTTKYTAGGSAITEISVATEAQWKDASGETKKETTWHRITFFGKLAEIAGQYLKKGKQVYVEGRLKNEQWEKDGQKHYSTKIIGEEMQFLGGNDSGSSGSQSANRQPAQRQAPAQRSSQNRAPPPDEFDSDIPF